MKCPKCKFNNIKYPFTSCPICDTPIKWTKKEIIKNFAERIILSFVVTVITFLVLDLILK